VQDLLGVADIIDASSVQLLFDGRNHAVESLMHPGLADTQGPALLMHLGCAAPLSYVEVAQLLSTPLKLATFRENDPATLRGYPRGGQRLNAAFALTDCLQILTGDMLYLFDPSGTHLLAAPEPTAPLSSVSTRESPGKDGPAESATVPEAVRVAKGQRCQVTPGVRQRFPDQLAPLLSVLAKCDSRGRGVLLRMPLRRKPSALSGLTPTQADVRRLLIDARPQLEGTLLFSRSTRCAAVSRWLPAPVEYVDDYRLVVGSQPNAKDNRFSLLANKTWKQSALQSLWSKFVPLELQYTVEITTSFGSGLDSPNSLHKWLCADANADYFVHPDPSGAQEQAQAQLALVEQSRWMVCAVLGAGTLRDLALREPFRPLRLKPFVSIALHLGTTHGGGGGSGNATTGPVLRTPACQGFWFAGGGPLGRTGLPFHVEGSFLPDYNRRRAGQSFATADWLSASGRGATSTVDSQRVPGPFRCWGSLAQVEARAWNCSIMVTALGCLLPSALQVGSFLACFCLFCYVLAVALLQLLRSTAVYHFRFSLLCFCLCLLVFETTVSDK
jgi:hypothetical protein